MDYLLHEREGLFILFILIALPFAVYFDNKMKRKRFEAYAKMGFAPMPESHFKRWARLEYFGILEKMGFMHNADEYMIGEYRGHKIGLFLHIVADGSKTGKRQTAAIIQLEGKLPSFVLRPESFRDKVNAQLGNGDINFEHDGLFSKKYFLQGQKEAEIRKLFETPKVRNYFSAQNGLWVQSIGSKILMFQVHDVLTDDKQMRRIVERAIQVKALLEGLDLRDSALGAYSRRSALPRSMPVPESMEWNFRNGVVVLSVLAVVLGVIYLSYADSKKGFDARMAKYDEMTTEEMAAYLAGVNAGPQKLDAVTRHAGSDLNGTVIYFNREVSGSFLSFPVVNADHIESDAARMRQQLKEEMCSLPTWERFYNKGGELVFVYYQVNGGERTHLFDVKTNRAFCL